MHTYLCRLIGYDDTSYWESVSSDTPANAAAAYADRCDNRNVGEVFLDELENENVIMVKDESGKVYSFEISFYHSKYFFAKEQTRAA